MLDIKFIRENTEAVKASIKKRGNAEVDIDRLLALDERRRKCLVEVEGLKKVRNDASDEIGGLKREGKDAAKKIQEMKEFSGNIKELDAGIAKINKEARELSLLVPNMLDESVPEGSGEGDNAEVKKWGEQPSFSFEAATHIEIGKRLKMINLEAASKLSGSNFSLLCGMGAQIERALINFMLDLHRNEHNYTEVSPPYLVTADCMTGTGQLPKMKEDMYHLGDEDLFLIPTAEVPVTNIHRDEILDAGILPLCYTSYTACFRKEAGSYGKDSKGLVRIHQFNKVELVKFVRPQDSDNELEKLLNDAEDVLQRLGLHYRIMRLCSREISFAGAKCYDIEVWAPGMKRYLEVSSCSSFADFQARRANIRFRPASGESPVFVHTLNGSGVALPRLMIALLETYQQENGSILIPSVLQPYLGGVEKVEK